MSKVCPSCGYPNPDHLTECFRCHEDISDERLARERARVNRERRIERETQREENYRNIGADIDSTNENIMNIVWNSSVSPSVSWNIKQIKILNKLVDISVLISLLILILSAMTLHMSNNRVREYSVNPHPVETLPYPQNDMGVNTQENYNYGE